MRHLGFSLVLGTIVALPGLAWGQAIGVGASAGGSTTTGVGGTADATAAPAAPAPAATDPAAPPPAPPPPPPEQAAAAPAEAAPAAEEEDADDSGISGWFRFDADDWQGLQLWAGATHPINDDISIATDIHVYGLGINPHLFGGAFAFIGQIDGGVTFGTEHLAVTPMLGFGFDILGQQLGTLALPQVFLVFDNDMLVYEGWVQLYLNDVITTGNNVFYTRNFLLFKVTPDIQLGPQLELGFDLTTGDLATLPIGLHVGANYAKGNSIGVMLGYEIEDTNRSNDGIVGRFTYVHAW